LEKLENHFFFGIHKYLQFENNITYLVLRDHTIKVCTANEMMQIFCLPKGESKVVDKKIYRIHLIFYICNNKYIFINIHNYIQFLISSLIASKLVQRIVVILGPLFQSSALPVANITFLAKPLL